MISQGGGNPELLAEHAASTHIQTAKTELLPGQPRTVMNIFARIDHDEIDRLRNDRLLHEAPACISQKLHDKSFKLCHVTSVHSQLMLGAATGDYYCNVWMLRPSST